MIGRLSGILIEKKPPFLLVEVNGVGYEIQAPMSTIYKLPELGQPVKLHTHFYVREDQQLLFGFMDDNERSLFRTLIKISGVGPKMALTILSGMEASVFMQCVESRRTEYLTRLPGIGKKTAERLLVEMSGRLKDLTEANPNISFNQEDNALKDRGLLAENEAISALIALGYKPQEASRAIAKILEPDLPSQELIRRALKSQTKSLENS